MANQLTKTVRIVRRSKVATDDRGQTVWVDPVESAELALVTTTMLKEMLTSDDEQQKMRIREAAEGKDGLLAHDAESDRFEIIGDADLQAAIDASAGTTDTARPTDVTYEVVSEYEDDSAGELSLVSTQALRRILHSESGRTEDIELADDEGGFDPYNSG